MQTFPTVRDKFYHARHLYRCGLRDAVVTVDKRLTRSGRNAMGLQHYRPLCDKGEALFFSINGSLNSAQVLKRYAAPPVMLSVARYNVWYFLYNRRYRELSIVERATVKSMVSVADMERGKSWWWMHSQPNPRLPR